MNKHKPYDPDTPVMWALIIVGILTFMLLALEAGGY